MVEVPLFSKGMKLCRRELGTIVWNNYFWNTVMYKESFQLPDHRSWCPSGETCDIVTYVLSNSPSVPRNACSWTHKCHPLPSQRVFLEAMKWWEVHWPGMAASPGIVRLVTRALISFPIRGHHTDCTAHSLHFATAMWPSWILCRICFLRLKGMRILSAFSSSPSWTLSSALMMKKSLTAYWTSSLHWGQPRNDG